MTSNVKFGELRQLLLELGFREAASTEQTAFRHAVSDILFVFRPYRAGDLVADYNLAEVQAMLDARGLMSAEAFDSQFRKTPA
ncbi:MAG: hypothetical protein JNM56_06945 [Planctomycetia bacterium]|nr:hypothetical protein [Planctomycetia bacterium]